MSLKQRSKQSELSKLDQSELARAEAALQAELIQREIRQKSATDYELFAREFLRIRSKSGAISALAFNRAQRHIHERLEEQKARTGRVRAMILKGRQQGCSTYVGGRYYHRVTHHRGLQVFILSHQEEASKNLFEMVERFQQHNPDPPSAGTANARELWFDALH